MGSWIFIQFYFVGLIIQYCHYLFWYSNLRHFLKYLCLGPSPNQLNQTLWRWNIGHGISLIPVHYMVVLSFSLPAFSIEKKQSFFTLFCRICSPTGPWRADERLLPLRELALWLSCPHSPHPCTFTPWASPDPRQQPELQNPLFYSSSLLMWKVCWFLLLFSFGSGGGETNYGSL